LKSALILGVTGQDGSYLADLLLKKGYKVYGSFRRTSHRLFERLEYFDILEKIELVKLDMTDQISINKIIRQTQPDELYNLAAQSFVGVSFDQPILTSNVNALGALALFETIKESSPHTKLYQASSSEMFGNSNEVKNEFSRMNPASPYGVSKVFAHKTAQHYREAYDLFISCGILFNHESPLRGLEFVTRKITHNIARIKLGLDKKLFLGNINAKRDWGFAGDYVQAMWLMLQQDKASDYVIATGKSYSVKEFLKYAFDYSELGNWEDFVEIDKKYLRPQDIDNLEGDATKAQNELNWKPSMSFEKLIESMVDSDLELAKNMFN